MNKYYALLIAGGITFGTASIFIKLSNMTPGALAFFRFFIVGLIFFFISRVDFKKILKYSPFGFLLALHMITFIISVYTTTIIDATVLVSTSPFFVILLSRFTKFKNTVKDIMGSVIGFVGVVLINYPLVLGYLVGNVIALFSAFLIALYTVFLSRVEENSIALTSAIYISSSLFTFPLFVIQGFGKIDLTSVLSLLGLIFLPTLIGHTSVVIASGKVKPQHIEIIGLLEPVIASILAIFIFHQIPTAFQLMGSALILFSVLYIIM
ncbi:DMT family transporter [Sulfolobus sp. S-194]|uniref:DMT family transporter n=1 Tax=Sulfolobus sp. S-194 TaxID=2512240 RepID=UPI0014373D3C|nr:DMT family transporter [Sulfolobus sp. S-194]QIW25251.1 DMT family transporter [Sulfolobus sp. S-194]